MRRTITPCLASVLVLLAASALAAQSKWIIPENLKALTSYIQAPVFPELKADPSLPRVLILGDSISMQYTPEVRRLLSGKANVYRVPDNGKSTEYGLAHIGYWLGDGNWAVIHFNFGLHDIVVLPAGNRQVSIHDHNRNLHQLVKRLQATSAKLIWASTTPVPEGSRNRRERDVAAYNAVARKVMEENNVPIDDLHSFVDSRPDKALADWQYHANVHFTANGCVQLAQTVTKYILAALSQ